MIEGNPKTKVTKTDVCRLLNEHAADKFPQLVPLLDKYVESCGRARRHKVGQFGFWLRQHKPVEFQRCYKWALKHPMEVLDTLYSTDSDANP